MNIRLKRFSIKILKQEKYSSTMHVVEHLFYDDIQDDEKQQYALKLVFEIKNYFRKDWEGNWKNDIFLGGLYEMLWQYDECYLCYMLNEKTKISRKEKK